MKFAHFSRSNHRLRVSVLYSADADLFVGVGVHDGVPDGGAVHLGVQPVLQAKAQHQGMDVHCARPYLCLRLRITEV